MSYTSLTGDKDAAGSIKRWIVNDTIDAGEVLHEAEQFIYQRLRTRDMLAQATGTIALDATSIAFPTRFLTARTLWITGKERAEIHKVEIDALDGLIQYDASDSRVASKPRHFAEAAATLELAEKSDKAYGYSLWHYARPESLSNANETNFLTDRHPRALRLACMGYASEFLLDLQAAQHYLTQTTEAIAAINIEDDKNRYGSHVVVTPE